MGPLLAFIAALCFSAANIFIKKGVDRDDHSTGLFISILSNAVILCAIMVLLAVIGRLPGLTLPGVAYFTLAGFLTAFCARGLLFAGIHHIGAARAGAVTQASPAVAVVVAVSLLGEQLSAKATVGIVIALAGVGIFIADSYARPRRGTPTAGIAPATLATAEGSPAIDVVGTTTANRAERTGLLVSCLAAGAFGLGHICRELGLGHISDPVVGAAMGSIVALIASSAVLVKNGTLRPGALPSGAWTNRHYWFTGLASTIAQLAFFAALIRSSVSVVTVIVGSQSVMTVFMSAAFLRADEPITARVYVAAVTICAGGVLLAFA